MRALSRTCFRRITGKIRMEGKSRSGFSTRMGSVGSTAGSQRAKEYHMDKVPVIDVSPLSQGRPQDIADEVRDACSQWGFFQIVNHPIHPTVVGNFQEKMHAFFDLPQNVKDTIRRSQTNSRGFFDDELTKRKRDWKQGFDFGITPASRDSKAVAFSNTPGMSDDDPRHGNLDGFNRFPLEAECPGFRLAMWSYFSALTSLAESMSQAMAIGMGVDGDFFKDQLRDTHTSFLRLNYYPPLASDPKDKPLGISPHTDAGFLTLLLQDDECHSLQVRNRFDDTWHDVTPIPGALTVNTGDMAQVWSNNRYIAPEHRVLGNNTLKRYSAPFFYNPGYQTTVVPIGTCVSEEYPQAYTPLNWGYFRWQRFAGDFADFGTEVQISDFSLDPNRRKEDRVKHQAQFLREFDGGLTAKGAL
ncbi:hypothetical protein AAMO2058_000209100 [Amorphochlora amoebiformis]